MAELNPLLQQSAEVVALINEQQALTGRTTPEAMDALAAGKHVLVEKPAARSVEEVDRLIAAAARAGTQVRVGFNHRYHPALLEAQRLLAAEITREKLFLNLKQELPYSVAVETERWEEKSDGSVRIEQIVYVSRESHRPIVLGQGGQRIKAIGAAARTELGALLGRPVHLFLHVKVNERWNEQRGFYAAWGLDFDA